MSDPVKAIGRRIRQHCMPFAVASVRKSRSRPWRSLLFDGARHRIDLSINGGQIDEAIDALHDAIDEAGFGIAGHLVAELRIANIERDGEQALVTLDALTIES
jgi:hypothetical protein